MSENRPSETQMKWANMPLVQYAGSSMALGLLGSLLPTLFGYWIGGMVGGMRGKRVGAGAAFGLTFLGTQAGLFAVRHRAQTKLRKYAVAKMQKGRARRVAKQQAQQMGGIVVQRQFNFGG